MPYTVTSNGSVKGTYDDFVTAYKAAITQEMIALDETNLWHVMMLAYAIKQIKTTNPLRIAYQENTPIYDVYISHQ